MNDAIYLEAISTLQRWMDQAREAGEVEPTAMTIATVGDGGQPSVRVVLLKALDPRGPVFYTNLQSRKGRELSANPAVAACFYFTRQERQVRVEGRAEVVSDEEANCYFASRHRNSQLGAWASNQSQPLDSRAQLEARLEQLSKQYEGQEVPRPAHWSGVRISPTALEIWQGRAHRIHERWRYEPADQGWQKTLLQP